MRVAEGPVPSRTGEFAELMRQMPTSCLSTSGSTRHRVCDSSGDTWEEEHDASIYNMCVNADEAAAVENLRAELA